MLNRRDVHDVYQAAFAMSLGAEFVGLREEYRDGRTWYVFEFGPERMPEVQIAWASPNSVINTRKFVGNLKFLRGKMQSARRTFGE